MATPSRYSAYRFCAASDDPQDGYRALSERDIFAYRDLPDTVAHTVVEGETLWTIAGLHYAGVPRGCGLWWVIADFQPPPIYDPTIRLEPGTTLYLPSQRVLLEQILSDRRLNDVILP